MENEEVGAGFWLLQPSVGLGSGSRVAHLRLAPAGEAALCGYSPDPPAVREAVSAYPQGPPGATRCRRCEEVLRARERRERPVEPDGGPRPTSGPTAGVTAALGGHVAWADDGRLSLSPSAQVVGGVALLGLVLAAALSGG